MILWKVILEQVLIYLIVFVKFIKITISYPSGKRTVLVVNEVTQKMVKAIFK